MGRHKQIESLFLQELTADEERSERAIQVIKHQRHAIYALQKELDELKNTIPPPQNHGDKAAMEDYVQIQNEVSNLRALLKELQQKQKQIANEKLDELGRVPLPTEVEIENPGPLKRSRSRKKSNPFFDGPDTVIQVNHVTIDEPHKIKMRKEGKADIKRRLDVLNQKVAWLKLKNDETLKQKKDQLKWRHRVNHKLRDLSSGVNWDICEGSNRNTESDNKMKITSQQGRNAWRTARQYFSTDESHYLLSLSYKM